jgi:transcriptional regulator with XRE-family HTH domain
MPRHNDRAREIDSSVAIKVHELRVAMGMSREDLAEKVGVTHQQIQKYETSKDRISSGRLALIANGLKKPISYFFDEEEVELPGQHRRMALEVTRNFLKIQDYATQTGVNYLIKVLSKEK